VINPCYRVSIALPVPGHYVYIKHDVIRKTGSTQHIATPPDEDRATDTDNMRKNLTKIRHVVPEIMLADRQTDTVITVLCSDIGGGMKAQHGSTWDIGAITAKRLDGTSWVDTDNPSR